jgi:hypothetical protein
MKLIGGLSVTFIPKAAGQIVFNSTVIAIILAH